jgi:hypothetical protein
MGALVKHPQRVMLAVEVAPLKWAILMEIPPEGMEQHPLYLGLQ